MICSPCLSDLHEFCRGDVRDCTCECNRWDMGTDLDDDFDEDEAWQKAQNRYEQHIYRDKS